jgi:hypothetical protein
MERNRPPLGVLVSCRWITDDGKEGHMDEPDAFMEEVKTAKGRKDLPCSFVRSR